MNQDKSPLRVLLATAAVLSGVGALLQAQAGRARAEDHAAGLRGRAENSDCAEARELRRRPKMGVDRPGPPEGPPHLWRREPEGSPKPTRSPFEARPKPARSGLRSRFEELIGKGQSDRVETIGL